jgi:hypothetical protein
MREDEMTSPCRHAELVSAPQKKVGDLLSMWFSK